jgi:hypothetical protein
MATVGQSCTSSDNQCELLVKSLAASVWVQLQSAKYQAPKAKARTRRKEVGLNIDFSTTLFGSSEWMIKSGEDAGTTAAMG